QMNGNRIWHGFPRATSRSDLRGIAEHLVFDILGVQVREQPAHSGQRPAVELVELMLVHARKADGLRHVDQSALQIYRRVVVPARLDLHRSEKVFDGREALLVLMHELQHAEELAMESWVARLRHLRL